MSYFYTPGLLATLTDDENLPENPRIGYENRITSAVASDVIAGFPASNVTNPSTAEKWKAPFTSSVTLDFSTSTGTVDYIAIVGHNLNSLDNAEFKLQYDNGGGYTDVFDFTFAPDNNAIIYNFEPIAASQWRFIVDPQGGSSTEDIEIAVVYLGNITVLPRRIYRGHSPVTLNRKTEVISNNAETGEFLGRIVKRTSINSSASFQNIDPLYYRNTIEPFARASQESPFFFAWRPQTYGDETAYCWMTSDVAPKNQLANGMVEFGIKFRAYLPNV